MAHWYSCTYGKAGVILIRQFQLRVTAENEFQENAVSAAKLAVDVSLLFLHHSPAFRAITPGRQLAVFPGWSALGVDRLIAT